MKSIHQIISILILFIFINLNFSLAASLNEQGFTAYKNKKYSKALEFFEKATQAEPKNHYAWLNYGRTLVATNKNEDPEDYCDYQNNWILKTLHHLEKAVSINKTETLNKIVSSDEPFFKDFMNRQDFKNWYSTASYTSKDVDLNQFISKNPDWHNFKDRKILPKLYTFLKNKTLEYTDPYQNPEMEVTKTWKWEIKGQEIIVKEEKSEIKYKVVKQFFKFEPNLKLRIMRLTLIGSDPSRTLYLGGSEIPDCN